MTTVAGCASSGGMRLTGTLRHANDFSPDITRTNLAQQSEEEFAIPLETMMQHRGEANGAGEGITEAADNFVTSVVKAGSLITTTIVIDLDGLDSGGAIDDIIGAGGGAKESHLGQITAAKNGTIFAGKVTCLEVPTGGDPDIDIYCATEDTGVEDALVTDLTETILLDHGDWTTAGETSSLTTMPTVNEYLYLA
ncbi:MAG: hypothetical protein ACYS7Y_34750, partial [Planctomycetota bacterium]